MSTRQILKVAFSMISVIRHGWLAIALNLIGEEQGAPFRDPQHKSFVTIRGESAMILRRCFCLWDK